MLWLEIILEIPLLLLEWLIDWPGVAICPECGARLSRVKSARKETVFLCRQCDRYWMKKGDRVQPLESVLERKATDSTLR